MPKAEYYLSGKKMLLVAIIPIFVIAIFVIVIPYVIFHNSLFVTPIIFISITSFIFFLRFKYFWFLKNKKLFNQISTVIIWIIFILVIPFLVLLALLTIFVYKKSTYFFVWILSVVTIFIFGIRIKIRGKIPKEQFILIWNHCSNVDDVLNPIIMGRSPWKVIFAKEMKRILFVGSFLNYIGIPVSRSEITSKIKVAKQVIDYLKEKKGNILVFPEGRRLLVEKKEELLMNFQPGAFRWSIDCNVPILPVVVSWTFLFKPRSGQWWFSPRTIVINYLDPVYVLEGETVESFSNRVRDMMLEKLKSGLKNKNGKLI